MAGSENGNGVLKRWHVYAALFSVVLAAAKIVFFAGDSSARTEEKIANLNSEYSQLREEYAKKVDSIEKRLEDIEKSQQRAEQAQIDLSKTLDDIKGELRRRR